VEILTIRKKLGGNGPIMADALERLGFGVTYIGCVGEGPVHPVFRELAERCRMIGIAAPAQTDAMEFFDGKLIRGKLDSVNKVTWADVKRAIPAESIAEIAAEARLIGFLNWSLVANMSGFYQGFLSDVAPLLTASDREGKVLFFDLADPAKRSVAEIKNALSLIEDFADAGFQTILGLNKKEACEIAEIFGMEIPDFRDMPLEPLASFLAERIRISCLVIHPVDRACCLYGDVYAEQGGPFCARPRLTTGAGDNFNAGFVTGFCEGLDIDSCLLLGNAASGYYVRNEQSGTRDKLISFLKKWDHGEIE
jgi:sugar/nucleoside kinase (ribokinase family)